MIYLLTILLLALPMGWVKALPRPLLRSTVPCLRTLLERGELIDPREGSSLLPSGDRFTEGEFLEGLLIVRARIVELSDAPCLLDCQRLPSRAVAGQRMQFTKAYIDYCSEASHDVINGQQYYEAKREAEQLWLLWDHIRDAQCDYYYVSYRRRCLKKLRQAIGQDAYYAGIMPPHIPLWRFRRDD